MHVRKIEKKGALCLHRTMAFYHPHGPIRPQQYIYSARTAPCSVFLVLVMNIATYGVTKDIHGPQVLKRSNGPHQGFFFQRERGGMQYQHLQHWMYVVARGCWGVLLGLLIPAAGGSIVAGGGSIFAGWGLYCCWKGVYGCCLQRVLFYCFSCYH